MRTFKASKTRAGKPKITLYEDGIKLLERPVASTEIGIRIGLSWADSEASS